MTVELMHCKRPVREQNVLGILMTHRISRNPSSKVVVQVLDSRNLSLICNSPLHRPIPLMSLASVIQYDLKQLPLKSQADRAQRHAYLPILT